MRRLIAGLLFAVAAPALAQTAPAPPTGQDANGLVWVKEDDARMTAAIAEAKRTLPDFLAHLAHPGANEQGFGVKYDIIPGPKAEFIWTHDLRVDATRVMTGALDDDAQMIDGFKANRRVTIVTTDIIDWGYFKDKVMQGNRTTRVLLDMVDADEAAAIRRAFGW